MSHLLDYMELTERVDGDGNTLLRIIKYVKKHDTEPELKTTEIVEDAITLIPEDSENHTNLGAIMDMLRAEKTNA